MSGGRITPFKRPISVRAAASVAPVLPGEKKPSASLSLTKRAAIKTEAFFLCFIPLAGLSFISIISSVCLISTRLWSYFALDKALVILFSFPTNIKFISLFSAKALTAPRTNSSRGFSPLATSMAKFMYIS